MGPRSPSSRRRGAGTAAMRVGSSGPLPSEHVATLAQKLLDGQLVLFVGAGLSRLASAKDGSSRRLPLWDELMELVAKACHIKPAAFKHNPLDVFDAVIYRESRGKLEQTIRDALDDSKFDLSAAHEMLARLPWSAVMSTNYDGLLQRLLKEAPVYDEQDYDRLALAADKRPRLFQVHGTLERPHTLTRADYREWEVKHPRAYSHLRQLVDEKTVLFVGYSISDPHVDELLATIRRITHGREKRLYAWMWQIDPDQTALLDRRDKIAAISIRRESAWVAAFEQVSEELGRRQRSGSEPLISGSFDAHAYDREQYLAGLNARHGIANLQALYQWGAGYARDDVRLEEIFVEPDLEGEVAAQPLRDVGTPRLTGGSLEEALRQREEQLSPDRASQRKPALSSFAELPRLIVVGAPGQGKSTLLRYSLLKAAASWRSEPEREPFPVYVRLADWELSKGPSEGRLIDYATRLIPGLGEISSIAAKAWLDGPVHWLLDGVDEIRDLHERERFREELAVLALRHPSDRWIITTRPAGEPEGGFSADWARRILPALSEQQVTEVLKRWAEVLKRKEGLDFDARTVAAALRKDPGLRGIRGNALLLTLAVLFYKSRQRLPHDRWEFYSAAEQALRDAWVRSRVRDAERHLPSGDYLPQLLDELALAGMAEGLVLFERARLKTFARKLLRLRGYTGREQDQEVGRFIRAAQDLIGVIVEQGPERFGFLHLTFQEFFAARRLSHLSTEAAEYLRRFWDHPAWSEVWVLYALAIERDRARFGEALKVVLREHGSLDEYLHRAKLFCLKWCGVTRGELDATAQQVVDWAETTLKSGGAYVSEEITRMLGQWQRPFTPRLRAALLKRLEDKDGSVRSAAAQALAAGVSDAAVRAALLKRLEDEDGSVRSAAAQALRRVARDLDEPKRVRTTRPTKRLSNRGNRHDAKPRTVRRAPVKPRA